MDSGSGGDGFDDRLTDLREEGFVGLVVGDVPKRSFRRVARHMLGDGLRRRVVAVGGSTPDVVTDYLPETAGSDDCELQVVFNETDTRSTATKAPGSGSTVTPRSRLDTAPVPSECFTSLENADLGLFGANVSDAITRLDRCVGGGFSPGELRVVIDGVDHLFDTSSNQATLKFVHLLAHQIVGHSGIGYILLPVPRENQQVLLLKQFVDVVVELRANGEDGQQRWHIQDGPSSQWMPIC